MDTEIGRRRLTARHYTRKKRGYEPKLVYSDAHTYAPLAIHIVSPYCFLLFGKECVCWERVACYDYSRTFSGVEPIHTARWKTILLSRARFPSTAIPVHVRAATTWLSPFSIATAYALKIVVWIGVRLLNWAESSNDGSSFPQCMEKTLKMKKKKRRKSLHSPCTAL